MVLCPEGIACVIQDNSWTTIRKPKPEGMADWTHLSPDSTGNIVGKDRLIGQPPAYAMDRRTALCTQPRAPQQLCSRSYLQWPHLFNRGSCASGSCERFHRNG